MLTGTPLVPSVQEIPDPLHGRFPVIAVVHEHGVAYRVAAEEALVQHLAAAEGAAGSSQAR